ncbi:MAG: hypothetical protein J1F17_01720 [Oscillospiraceae bacterium]|nr:hypothetical protein [Oscillospiraceae bacterium]
MEEFLNKIKEYLIISIVMSVSSLCLNPSKSFILSLRNSLISFFIPMFVGMFIHSRVEDEFMRYGIVGFSGLLAIWLYELCLSLLGYIKENPDKLLFWIKKD